MTTSAAKNFIQILGKQYKADQWTNLTPKIISLAERQIYKEKINPLYLICERIRDYFLENKHQDIGYNYQEHQFHCPVVTLSDNFDSLLIPPDHISRGKSDTYYLNSQQLLRSHTSAHQTHCLERDSKAFISLADCFRRDEIDRSHFPVFHQCEVFKLYNHKEALGASSSPEQLYDPLRRETESKQAVYTQEASLFAEIKLKSTIESFVRDFFDDPSLKTRWVSAYFPFTHPSFELEILWRDKWLEVLGCGVVRDEILANVGLRDHVGFAAGFGLERFGMLKYAIPDIRLFWTRDTGFLHQFENKSPFDVVKFKQFSQCPQCINDLSFWLPDKEVSSGDTYSPNDFYDLCRSIGGDLVEQVRLVDVFKHPKSGKTSHCYRIIYRAADHVLTKDEVNQLHAQISQACRDQFSVDLR